MDITTLVFSNAPFVLQHQPTKSPPALPQSHVLQNQARLEIELLLLCRLLDFLVHPLCDPNTLVKAFVISAVRFRVVVLANSFVERAQRRPPPLPFSSA